jgi:hypothetical protein
MNTTETAEERYNVNVRLVSQAGTTRKQPREYFH